MDENQLGGMPSAVQPEQQQSNLLTQEQVNKIVAREKASAAEKATRAAEEKYQRDIEGLNALRAQQEQTNAQVPRETSADAIYQQVQERFNKEMQERQLKAQMEQVANNYLSKVAQGKTAYQDFDEVTKDFDPTAFPQLTFLLSGIDNAGDVLYDLSKNPLKLAGIDRLAEKNPRQAQNELLKLSKSILDNRQAQAEAQGQNVAEPLDRLSPSKVSGSNGKMGIRDLRNQPWLKG
jgi:hypothetical protein